MNYRNRFEFKAKPPVEEDKQIYGTICPGCNTRRTAREFQGIGETFKNCAVCRARGASRETVKA